MCRVSELADKIQAIPYKRSGKIHTRERCTVLKYARVLFDICPTGDMSSLEWIRDMADEFHQVYQTLPPIHDTCDVRAIRDHRRAVRELTALRAGAEVLGDERLVKAYGVQAATLQKGITAVEEHQTQSPEEKRTYRSFEELRANVHALREHVKDHGDLDNTLRHLVYELMVPSTGDYALRLDLAYLPIYTGAQGVPQDDTNFVYLSDVERHGSLVFNTYKTSKFKEEEHVCVSIHLTPEQYDAVRASLEKHPREFLMGTGGKASLGYLIKTAWILDKRPPPTANNIRSALITHFMNGENNKRPSLLAVREFAERSMTSPAMMEVVYHKVDAT
jgi:hypothetical protein